MWPRIIAGPKVPGVGEPVYQPGLESGSSSDGTSMVPSELRPRSISDELIPIAGTETATGGEAGSNKGPGAGAGAAAGALCIAAVEPGLLGAALLGAASVFASVSGDGLDIVDDAGAAAAAESARRLVFPGSSVTTPVRPAIVECYADAK